MSRLNELIYALCPNGVEYIPISHLIKQKTIVTITPSIKIKRNDYLANGSTPIISQEAEYISGYCNLDDKSIPEGNYVCFGDHSEHIKFINFAFVQGADGLKILRTDEEALSSRYLFHAASNNYCRHNNYERHFKYFTDTIIPLPPLPVQQEIVRILDSFTELTAELTAELAARRKQYEHYRDELLTFGDDVPVIKLGDACSVITKGTTPKTYTQSGVTFIKTEAITNNTLDYSKLSCIDFETHNTKLKRSILKADDILITIAGATIGKCTMVPKELLPANTNQALAIIRLNETVCKKYIFYILQSHHMKEYIDASAKGSAQPNLNLEQLNNFKLPLPVPIAQKRIVSILDRFDALCNNLTSGLPAENAARQKQYEYYRDKLLTFKELDA